MNIIITGASRGIGNVIAEKFASEGYSLFLCARDETALGKFAHLLRENNPGIRVEYKVCDVSVTSEVKAFAEWVLNATDDPGILVNNAGSFIQGGVHDEPEGALESLMATNLYSAYHLSRALIPAMIAKRSGHIFNICSIASLKAYPHGGAYSITKYAMAGMSANLRHELMPHNIKVTSVFPGAVYTDSWKASDLPESRFMSAADIADMIYACARLSPQACVEELVIRPQLGDISD